MRLKLLSNTFGILKLKPPQPFPMWLNTTTTFFIAQTADEFSVMCLQALIPDGIHYSADWRCFRADGDLTFDEVGVVARLSRPLADAGLSLFLVSTHDRDYVFVAQSNLEQALSIYKSIDFEITQEAK